MCSTGFPRVTSRASSCAQRIQRLIHFFTKCRAPNLHEKVLSPERGWIEFDCNRDLGTVLIGFEVPTPVGGRRVARGGLGTVGEESSDRIDCRNLRSTHPSLRKDVKSDLPH